MDDGLGTCVACRQTIGHDETPDLVDLIAVTLRRKRAVPFLVHGDCFERTFGPGEPVPRVTVEPAEEPETLPHEIADVRDPASLRAMYEAFDERVRAGFESGDRALVDDGLRGARLLFRHALELYRERGDDAP